MHCGGMHVPCLMVWYEWQHAIVHGKDERVRELVGFTYKPRDVGESSMNKV